MQVEDENWKYTLAINGNTNYHSPLNTILKNNNIRGGETFEDNRFENMAAFRGYVRDKVKEIAEAYKVVRTVNTVAVALALWDTYGRGVYKKTLEEESPPYTVYTSVLVEYVINGEKATITVSDSLAEYRQGQLIQGRSVIIGNKSPVLLTIAVEGALDQYAIQDYCLHIATHRMARLNIGVNIFDYGRGEELVAMFPWNWNVRTQIDNYVRSVFYSIRNDGEVEIDMDDIDWRGMDESRNEASVTIRTSEKVGVTLNILLIYSI